MTDSQRVSRLSVKWIEPPSVPDKDVIDPLREVLDTLPNVQSAYIVGERNTPDDGADPFETVGWP